MDRVVLKQWLTSGYMDQHVSTKPWTELLRVGIISPALANCALDGLERLLQEKFPQVNVSSPLEVKNLV